MIFPCRKKLWIKKTKFIINRKSVITSQNEEFVEKYDFYGPAFKKLLPFESVSNKDEENGFHLQK